MFTSVNGVEVENTEIEPLGTNASFLDKNRARVAELCKQHFLHLRTKEVRSEEDLSPLEYLLQVR